MGEDREMSKFIDLTGQRFGRLTVLKRQANNKHNSEMWLCQCDCGNKKVIIGFDLKRGHTKSCGCLKKEGSLPTHGHTAGGKESKTYITWNHMLDRCKNKNVVNYKDYGGRGISVCDRWLRFENFYADMGDKPEGLTLERIDNDGNYEPSNCKWATRIEQANNTRFNVFIEYDGQRLTIAQWARKIGMNYFTLHNRIRDYGWPIKKALTEPTR